MRRSRPHHSHIAVLGQLLLILIGFLPLLTEFPSTAVAQTTNNASFGSAVPCLTARGSFAVTCAVDNLVSPDSQTAATIAGLSETAKEKTLGYVGSTGAVYGLAYDDGHATGGTPRLFSAAYTKRFSSYGEGGPGGIYVTNIRTNITSLYTTITGVAGVADRSAATRDEKAIAGAGRTSLGDMEISPDGRTLFVMNLAADRIERIDISGPEPQLLTPISVDFRVTGAPESVWKDMVPFALEFFPDASNKSQVLLVGVTDTATRGAKAPGGRLTVFPKIYVLTYMLSAPLSTTHGTGTWHLSLTQDLNDAQLADRFYNSGYTTTWDRGIYPNSGYAAWNPWNDNLTQMPARSARGGTNALTIYYPQPLLTDIELDHTGKIMWLGLRDRTGDQVYNANAPDEGHTTIAQGDTLAYRLASGSWRLLTVNRTDVVNALDQSDTVSAAKADYFNDNIHAFNPGPNPPHTENHMGGLTSVVRVGTNPLSEHVMSTALLGKNESGTVFFNSGGGARNGTVTLITSGSRINGKATALGDTEWLCSYAFISGVVWKDSNNDGIRQDQEPRFPNITLEVFETNATTQVLAQAVTDSEGRYSFAVPANKDFGVRMAPDEFAPGGGAAGWRFSPANQGSDDTRDSEVDPVRGYMEFTNRVDGSSVALPLRLRESNEQELNIGLTNQPAGGEVGNFVWNDTNSDGIQRFTEQGIAGVSVALHRVTGSSNLSFAPTFHSYPRTTQTDATGKYRFDTVEPGRYYVQFTAPANYFATRRNIGSDSSDSDADPTTDWRTAEFDIAATGTARMNDTLDLGLVGSRSDVFIQKDGPTVTPVGTSFSYTLNWRYIGNRALSSVTVSDELPSGLTFVSANPAPSSRNGNQLSWSLGAMNSDRSGRITITVRAPTILSPASAVQQTVTNQALISSVPTDDISSNNAAAATTRIVRPEIEVRKRAPASVLVGEEFFYTVEVTNQGSLEAYEIQLEDNIPSGLRFNRMVQIGNGARCTDPSTSGNSRVSCTYSVLAAGETQAIMFSVTATDSVASRVTNTATITTRSIGDSLSNNSSSINTTVTFPNPGVRVGLIAETIAIGESIETSVMPAGTSGTLRIAYGNHGTGPANGSILRFSISSPDVSFEAIPAGCSYDGQGSSFSCALGTLIPPARASEETTILLPIFLPATFPDDAFSVTATISTINYERIADRSNNTATANISIIRPNVYVDAAGPSAVIAQGSAIGYTLDYGNRYRRNPNLTRAAEHVVLQATLPNEVTFVEATVTPTRISGRTLTWNLGALAAQRSGQIVIVGQTDVAAGTELIFRTEISTTTPADDPIDNRDTVATSVVQPLPIPAAGGDLRLAIHSEFDPNSRDLKQTNGVYISQGGTIAWPAGEVLDFTPRIQNLDLGPPQPWPLEYRARVAGWSIVGFTVNGRAYSATAADNRGRAGCRPGNTLTDPKSILAGCRYRYLGGENLAAIANPQAIREDQMERQGHAYWAQPPAPPMRKDVYVYSLEPMEAVQVTVQVEVEIWVVNAYPGEIGGIPLPIEQIAPLPEPERQVIERTFDITLLVPRSIVGPGSIQR